MILRVGVDLDGVGFNFHSSFLRYLDSISNGPYLNRGYCGDWHFYRKWGITDGEFVIYCNDAADKGLLFTGGVKRGFVNAMRRIKNTGSEIHIITDRNFGSTPEVSRELTRKWLKKYSIPYDTLTFSADKTIVPTDMFVEDKLQNYDDLVLAGTKAYLINRPWNNDLQYGRADGRNRIPSIEHFALHVERESKRLTTLV